MLPLKLYILIYILYFISFKDTFEFMDDSTKKGLEYHQIHETLIKNHFKNNITIMILFIIGSILYYPFIRAWIFLKKYS